MIVGLYKMCDVEIIISDDDEEEEENECPQFYASQLSSGVEEYSQSSHNALSQDLNSAPADRKKVMY